MNAEAISREDYLNAPGESFSVKFDTAGTYGYYCEPHQGAGMAGKIIVQARAGGRAQGCGVRRAAAAPACAAHRRWAA